jgi:hypothetical protein
LDIRGFLMAEIRQEFEQTMRELENSQFEKKIKAYQKKHKVSFSQALAAMAQEDPAGFHAYHGNQQEQQELADNVAKLNQEVKDSNKFAKAKGVTKVTPENYSEHRRS